MNQIVSAAAAVTAVPQNLAEVRAALTFIRPQDSKPAFHSSALTGGPARFFFETEEHEVAIDDLRPIADTLSIDREGFVLRHHPTAVADLYDDGAVERDYTAETEALLRREFGASRVVIFDSTRRSDGGAGAKNRDGLRGPAGRVHVDYTTKSGPQRVKDLLGEAEAASLADAGSRIVQINVWRPIRGPVERLDGEVSDRLWSNRARENQLAAWASRQSQELDDRATLVRRLDEIKSKHREEHIPRPPYWQAYRLTPERIEFWTVGWRRLHERVCHYQEDGVWKSTALQP